MYAPAVARTGNGNGNVLSGGNLPRELLIGLGAAGLGAVATYFGKKHLAPPPKIDNELAAQIRLMDSELRRIMRTKRHPQDLRLESRLDELRHRVRELTTAGQAKVTGRPTWAVRLADVIAGR